MLWIPSTAFLPHRSPPWLVGTYSLRSHGHLSARSRGATAAVRPAPAMKHVAATSDTFGRIQPGRTSIPGPRDCRACRHHQPDSEARPSFRPCCHGRRHLVRTANATDTAPAGHPSCDHSGRHLYHGSRTHLSLAKDAPESRAVEQPELGRIVALPQVGGLHHRYTRCAA